MVRKYPTAKPLEHLGVTDPLLWDGSQTVLFLTFQDDPTEDDIANASAQNRIVLFRWYVDEEQLKRKDRVNYRARVKRNKTLLLRFPTSCLPVRLAPKQFDQEAVATLIARYESYTRYDKSLADVTEFFNATVRVHEFLEGLPTIYDGMEEEEIAAADDADIFLEMPPPIDPYEIYVSPLLAAAREIAPVLTKAVDSWQLMHGPVSPEEREYVIRALLTMRVERENSWVEPPAINLLNTLINHGLIKRRLGTLQDDSDFCLSVLAATFASEDSQAIRAIDYNSRCACQRFQIIMDTSQAESDDAVDSMSSDGDQDNDDDSDGFL